MNYYAMDGNNYTHRYTNWYWQAEAYAQYKKWMAVFQFKTAWNNFWGETLRGGEYTHMLMVMYKHKEMSVGLGALNPFANTYKRENENWNQYASYKQVAYIDDTARLFLLKFTWNFSFGRKHTAIDQKLNNSDRDSGIMSVGK